MNYNEFIEVNPEIMVGKPVIKGTRITVEIIMEKLSARESIADILKSYPHLTRQQILAAIAFATESFKDLSFHPTVSK
jgi:uncharacterized protein (DUF433 family)